MTRPATTITLGDGACAIFGYGSLLSVASMERTLGRAYDRAPVACAIRGWRRSWDALVPNSAFYGRTEAGEFVPEHIVYLNVRPDEASAANGLLYVVDAADLRGFDEREWTYDRVDITAALDGVDVRGGRAYVYVGKPEWTLDSSRPRAWAAVRQSYLDIVETGLQTQPEAERADFRRRYLETTDAVPTERVFADLRRGAAFNPKRPGG
jgi:hypothetical protein